jgi:hypothetical protein
MAPSVSALRRVPRSGARTLAQARDHVVQRRVQLAWGLLVLDVMGYSGALIHIPGFVGKAITQGALPLALIVALTVNRHIIIRPNLFLCLVTLLPIEAILTSLQPQYLGTVYRTFRLIEFVAALWLLTPWWGRRDMLLVRCHLKALGVILGSVLLGLLVAPGHALMYGRLGGALWTIPPTQVGHYAAVTLGLIVVLWLCSELRGWVAAPAAVVALAMLVLSHTRTALVGAVAGILVAGLSLIVAKARVRKMFAIGGAVVAIAIMTASSLFTTWLARGEGTEGLTTLTGRTKVWGPLLSLPRDRFQELFGFGLNNSSFNGLAIDSNWLSSYQEQGLVGLTICALMLIFLFVWAYFRPRGVHRALALFLVTYCLVASFTEDGFTDATPYLLELALAASLLMAPLAARLRPDEPSPP